RRYAAALLRPRHARAHARRGTPWRCARAHRLLRGLPGGVPARARRRGAERGLLGPAGVRLRRAERAPRRLALLPALRATRAAARVRRHRLMPLLEVRDLCMVFPTEAGDARAVDGVSFTLDRGRVLGLVGESGCGKSMTALSLMRLVPPPGRIAGGQVIFEGRDLLALSEREMRAIRGARMAMIFQEPMTALNPVLTVGGQVAEAVTLHRPVSRRQAWERAAGLLAEVGIPDAARRAHDYPHQLSGGMRQRVMIAMAIACDPLLLLADEPTTAL